MNHENNHTCLTGFEKQALVAFGSARNPVDTLEHLHGRDFLIQGRGSLADGPQIGLHKLEHASEVSPHRRHKVKL